MPTQVTQFTANQAVTFAVVRDLGIPKLLITTRALVALWATVPKATIHKNNYPFASESEIRFP